MKNSLAFKLSSWICSILVLGFLVATVFLTEKSYNTLGKALDDEALGIAKNTASQLDKIFLQTKSMVLLLADELENNPQTKENLPKYIERRLRLIHREAPEIVGMAVACLPGILDQTREFNTYIMMKHQGKFHLKHWNSTEIDYQKYLDWFLVPITQERLYWTSPFIANTGQEISSCSVPFYKNIGGQRILAGCVVLDYDVRTLVNYLQKVYLLENHGINGQQYLSCLMNPFGKMIAASRQSLIRNETFFALCESSAVSDPEDFQRAREMFGRCSGEGCAQHFGKKQFKKAAILVNAASDVYYSRCLNDWVVAVAVPSNWRSVFLLPVYIKFFLGSIFLLLVIVGVIFIICRHLNLPLQRLAKAAIEVGGGNFRSALPDCTSQDEIGLLTTSFREMQNALSSYISQLEESIVARERTEGELNAAKAIQQDILPHILPPFQDFENLTGAAALLPARGVGGDLYDVFAVDNDHLAMIVGDVSGKGVPAALFMAVTQTLQRNIAMQTPDPAEMTSRLNSMLSANNASEMFVTYWVGLVNIRNGVVKYTCGGHNPPLLRHQDGQVEWLRERHGPPLGVLPNKKYRSGELKLQPGDTLVCYTDGVTEATNSQQQLFGDQRLFDTVAASGNCAPQDLRDTIVKAVMDFTGEAEQFDDITILITQYHPEETVNSEQ